MADDSKQGRVLSNSVIYALGLIVRKATGLLLIPVFSLVMTIDAFGVFSVVRSLEILISILMTLAIHAAGTRFTPDVEDDADELRSLWGTLIGSTLASTAAMAAVLLLLHPVLLVPLGGGIPFYPYLLLGVGCAATNAIFTVCQTYYRARQLATRFVANDAVHAIGSAALILFFVVGLEQQAGGALLGVLIANTLFAGYSLWTLRRFWSAGIDRTRIVHLLKYSLPLVPHVLASWIAGFVDRVFLNGLRGSSEAGVYTVGFQFAALLSVIVVGVNQAFAPWAFDQLRRGQDGRARIRQLAHTAVVIYAGLALVLSLLARELVAVLTSGDYEAGWQVMPYLMYGTVFTGVYFFGVTALFHQRTKLVPVVTGISAAANVVLNILLIPGYGVVGAALASLISLALSAVLGLLLSNRVDRIGLRWAPMMIPGVVGFGLSLLVFVGDQQAFGPSLGWRSGLALGCLGVLAYRYRRDLRAAADWLRKRNRG